MNNRERANIEGRKHYAPEEPCRRGHTALRFTSSGNCVQCHKENANVRTRAIARSTEILRLRADWSVTTSYNRP